LFSVFDISLSKVQIIILSSTLERTKNNKLRTLTQKGCAPLVYKIQSAESVSEYIIKLSDVHSYFSWSINERNLHFCD